MENRMDESVNEIDVFYKKSTILITGGNGVRN